MEVRERLPLPRCASGRPARHAFPDLAGSRVGSGHGFSRGCRRNRAPASGCAKGQPCSWAAGLAPVRGRGNHTSEMVRWRSRWPARNNTSCCQWRIPRYEISTAPWPVQIASRQARRRLLSSAGCKLSSGWVRPHVQVGNRYRMEEGEIDVDSIKPIGLPDITGELARESGFLGVVDLLKVAKHGKGENIYLVRFHYIRPRRE